MANDLTIRSEEFPQLATHWKRLQVSDMEAFRKSPLIGKWQITVIKRELEVAMQPAGPNNAAIVAGRLVGSYPRHLIEDPRNYSASLADVFMDFPIAVGFAAVTAVLRECKFMPSIAEVFAACNAQMGPLRWALFIAEQTERERKRREDEAREREQNSRDRMAFLVKHGGKSPLQVLSEMGLFNSKGIDDETGHQVAAGLVAKRERALSAGRRARAGRGDLGSGRDDQAQGRNPGGSDGSGGDDGGRQGSSVDHV